jgi:hypothetical protein
MIRVKGWDGVAELLGRRSCGGRAAFPSPTLRAAGDTGFHVPIVAALLDHGKRWRRDAYFRHLSPKLYTRLTNAAA